MTVHLRFFLIALMVQAIPSASFAADAKGWVEEDCIGSLFHWHGDRRCSVRTVRPRKGCSKWILPASYSEIADCGRMRMPLRPTAKCGRRSCQIALAGIDRE
jgi:hypothetical protein